MEFNWQLKHFDELSLHELYEIIWLRNEVFVVEQSCVFQDADHKDEKSWHLMCWDNKNKLLAYCRILPSDVSYEVPSIGRVVTSPFARRTGAGKMLMIKAIAICYELFGKVEIKIGAQLYLKKFYSSFGFLQTSEVYLEDGIEHIEMTLLV